MHVLFEKDLKLLWIKCWGENNLLKGCRKAFNCYKAVITVMITFWHLARSNGLCPPAGLLRGFIWTRSRDDDTASTCPPISSSSLCRLSAGLTRLSSSSSSEEDELKNSGSSFSRFLLAPATAWGYWLFFFPVKVVQHFRSYSTVPVWSLLQEQANNN